MPQQHEQKIISACLKNDRVAQKALYDQYKSKMYTLAYRITNNFEDANDILQDGFLSVFENLGNFKGNAQLGTWIHTIIARTALRKIKNKIQFVELNEFVEPEPVNWDSIIDAEHLEKAIAALPVAFLLISIEDQLPETSP